MKTLRIIPKLDIKGPNLVKGIHLEGLRVLGDPSEFARHYYEMGADELYFVDCVASLYGRNSIKEIISKTASNVFIPITVGGGIRTLDDIKDALRAGADKVSINTAALNNPDFISLAAKKFGSSTIVVAIEAIKSDDGSYLAYTDNGREYTGKDVFDWALEVESLGAGEIIITSVDKEGTGDGFDIELTTKLSSLVSVPVIAHGGAGNYQDCIEVIENATLDGISIASMLHYTSYTKLLPYSNIVEGNTLFASKGQGYHKFKEADLKSLKLYLQSKGVIVRI